MRFESEEGHALSGTLHHAVGLERATALFAHCFSCGKDLQAAERICARLASLGIATMRFDFTGLGESEGEFAETTFSLNLGDLRAAARFLAETRAAPRLLIGHSLGGAAVLAVAQDIESAQAVVTIGAPFDPGHVRKLFGDVDAQLKEQGAAEFRLGRRSVRMPESFFADLEKHCTAEAIAGLGRALVVFHSPQDQVVGIDNARRIYQAAKHPKSFISLDGAAHLLPRARDAEYVAEVMCAWASRYVDFDEPSDDSDEGWVVVRGGARGYTQSVRASGHALVADEPESVGGANLGPDPYGYLLSGLGACTSMTLRMYADRKGWPLQSIEVRLRHHGVHAKDCEACESTSGKADIIERIITLEGELDTDQRKRLLEIADRCPVHRTLRENEVIINTSVTDPVAG